MNREQRRQMSKSSNLGELNSPCTITEAVQIARGVAEDVIADYSRQQSHLQIAISLQIEILKSIAIKSGLITEDEFKKLYLEKAEEFNELQMQAFEAQQVEDLPKMEIAVSDFEVESK